MKDDPSIKQMSYDGNTYVFCSPWSKEETLKRLEIEGHVVSEKPCMGSSKFTHFTVTQKAGEVQ